MKGKVALLLVLVLAVVIIGSSVTIVWEDQYAVKVRLGEIVGAVTQPGLYFKIPFIEDYEKMTSRSLEYDSQPTDFITRDKKNIVIDTYARFKIADPIQFRISAQGSIQKAQSLLDDSIYSILRVEAGLMDFSDIIGEGRGALTKKVTAQADRECRENYGISVLSVRIKRVSLAPENERFVFDRMRAERQRQAKQYRSEGQEQALKIRAQTDKEKEIILAEAYKKAQQLIGEGEKEALRIYAEAFEKDPEFYAFLRSLEAYKKVFGDKTVIVLSPDDPFLKYFRDASR